MIFLLAGTSDARELAAELGRSGYPVTASVVTENAAKGLHAAGVDVRVGRLNLEQMRETVMQLAARMILDASHPFAEEAHKTAMAVARACHLPCVRYERGARDFSDLTGVTLVDSYEQAATVAKARKGSIMLTTGSKTLPAFTETLLGDEGIRLVVRMLPREDNLQKCEQLGVAQKNIIAMQGPFSRELNRELYRHFGTTLMITKESGEIGSVDEKVQAARDLGIEVVVIGRPKISYGQCVSTFADVLQAVKRCMEGI